jgi:hypothetical protein
MPSSVIGALRVALGIDSAQFDTGATKAEKRAEQLGARIASSLRGPIDAASSLRGALGALGGVAALGGLTALAQRSLDYASSLGEVAQQLGVTTKDLQTYRYAATQVGISQEEMDKGLAKLTVTMGQAREGVAKPKAAFKELADILGKDVLKNAATAGDAIPLIAEALSKVEDPAKRAAIEVALFGKTGQKLDTLLAGGAGAVNQLRDAAADLGLVLSEDQIANADQTADKLAELKQVLEANIAGAVANNATAIYDFVTALEKLISKIPVALNQLGKLQDYLNIGEGVGKSLIGLGLGDPARIAQGGQIAGAARQDLRDRQTYGPAGPQRQAYTASAARSLEQFRPTTKKGAGAGTSDADAAAAARKAASEAKAAAAARKREADKAHRDEVAYQRDLAHAQDDQIQAQLDLTVDQTERAALQQQLLDHDKEAKLQAIALDDHLSKEQKAQLSLIVSQTGTLRADLAHRQDREIVAKQALDRAQAQADNDDDILNAQAALATTAKERGEIERKILDKQFDMLRLVQQSALEQAQRSGDTQGAALAQQRLATLDTLQGLARAKSAKDNQGPLASYLDSIPKTAQEVNEALEGIEANGIDSLIDGIAKTKGNFKDLADVVSNVADDIIASLLKIGLQKGIAALFGSVLGGTGKYASPFGDAGSSFVPDSSGLNLSGFRAKGGSVIGGKNYVVGEMGPEIFTAPHSGSIVANDDIDTGGSMKFEQNINFSGGVDLATREEVTRMAGLTKQQTLKAISEANRRR